MSPSTPPNNAGDADTPSSSSEHGGQQPTQIRHSGDVQVRGRIRRVWRPRHLELYSDGRLEYYDQETNALKYTLQISSARILDGTTLRDLHVGLPRGTFGFLMRGQRVWNEETERLPAYERRAASSGTHFHPYASTANTALVSESFVLAEAPEPVRDYLCAVDSLEEAQMWVVALQWAATVTDNDMLSWWKVDYCASGSTPPASPAAQPKFSKIEQSAAPSKQTAKVLVAKVTDCTLVRSSTYGLELAYTIDVLLLSTSPSSTTTDSNGYSVEEWSLVRTADDFATVEPLQHPLPTWKTAKTASQIQNAISVLDSVLRSWVLSTDMVQNPAFQRFLALQHKTIQDWWHIHDPASIRSGPTESTAYQPPNQFVQSWLQRTQHSNRQQQQYTQQFVAWRPHLWWMGGLAMVAWPVAQRTLSYIPSIRLRLDCLLLSWAGAAYLGYTRRSLLLQEEKATTKKKRKQRNNSEASGVKESGAVPVPSLGEELQSDGPELDDDEESEGDAMDAEFSGTADQHEQQSNVLSSPLPEYPNNNGTSCWSQPSHELFHVRGSNYFRDKVKILSSAAPLTCRGVDMWLTDNPVRHIARHPAVAHNLNNNKNDKLVVNFLLPFANFVAYFDIPPLSAFPSKVGSVWSKFLQGDQQYRDARLKLLPVVIEGPWIVKTAVGPGKSPALLGKVIPLQYFFTEPAKGRPGIYEIDIIITASSIAKGILSVVKSQTKAVTIGFALIIEAAEQSELPENILCSFQVHSLHLEDCPVLPEASNLDEDL